MRSSGAQGKRSIEEIARLSFGSGYKGSENRGGVISFTFSPKLDGDSDQNFDRMLTIASTAAQTTFSQHDSVRAIRFTAVHESDPGRKLIQYILTREGNRTVDWMHGARADSILKAVRIEHVDPEFKSFTLP